MTETEPLPIDDKGRVSIPKDVRDQLGLSSGEKLALTVDKGEIRLRPVTPRPSKTRARRKWANGTFLDAGEALFAGDE